MNEDLNSKEKFLIIALFLDVQSRHEVVINSASLPCAPFRPDKNERFGARSVNFEVGHFKSLVPNVCTHADRHPNKENS